MALFNFGKKKEEEKKCGCSMAEEQTAAVSNTCCCGAENTKTESCGCEDSDIETLTVVSNIKILGSGCKSCHALYENVKEAVKNAGLSAKVEYITDLEKIMEYGVMSMPALVADEKVVSSGKVLKPADIEKLLFGKGKKDE